MNEGRTPGLAPRFAAWRILHDVRHGVPFDVALDRAIKDLDPPDKRLAHELAAGVFRSRSELDGVLAASIDRGLGSVRADLLDVLRLGAFQLLKLDKVPAHAAVQTTVGVGRRLGGRRVGGFVNAVLRRVGRTDRGTGGQEETDGRTEGLTDGGGEDPVRRLALAHSHPEWLVERWVGQLGPELAEARLEADNRRPPLVIQPNGIDQAGLARLLDQAKIEHRPAPWGAGLVVEAARPTALPGFEAGLFYVQDPAQRMVARFLAPEPGALVYDACAAPGGKAIAAAEGAGFVVAADRQRGRVHRLARNVERAGRGKVAPLVADVLHPPIRSADAVLLDVPCLGTGTFARNPDARWRVGPDALTGLVGQAARFLDRAAEIVRPGGLLLFATCSLEPEENEVQIARFLREDRRFRREPAVTVPPDLLTGDGDLLIRPELHGTGGAFAARLRKIAP